MEIRDFALKILTGGSLEEKLFTPETLTDERPGASLHFSNPSRSGQLQFSLHTSKDKLAPLHDLKLKDNRIEALHRFAGHELIAVEIMASALLAFPDAPKTFRKGLCHTLQEEQEHVRIYAKRLEEMGVQFGDLPLFRRFWGHVPYLLTPSAYVSAMSLTFEMANLDFAPMYGSHFAKYGDEESAKLMAIILRDEIAHVSFGYRWLNRWKEANSSGWQAWLNALPHTLKPRQARGKHFQREAREKAGLDPDWIERLSAL